ncbi:hypothetical protein A0H81_04103 [Grifola frondosa]|uniref:Uncharacterized protein n=1 Tax=Grifola frondosa TaxID=5627 RepID=A0A1C7MEL9_GRIFR|nr:hypothetical protein A0H81_04103 [Grifola frondosa]
MFPSPSSSWTLFTASSASMIRSKSRFIRIDAFSLSRGMPAVEQSQRQVHTLPVRSSRPIGVPAHLAPITQQVLNKQPPCVQISDDVYEAQLPSLITLRSSAPGEIANAFVMLSLNSNVSIRYKRIYIPNIPASVHTLPSGVLCISLTSPAVLDSFPPDTPSSSVF